MNYVEWDERVEVGKHADWLDEKPPLLHAGEQVQCPVCGLVHEASALQAYQWVFDVADGADAAVEEAYCMVISPPCHPDNTTVMPVIKDGVTVGTYNGFTVDYYVQVGGDV